MFFMTFLPTCKDQGISMHKDVQELLGGFSEPNKPAGSVTEDFSQSLKKGLTFNLEG